MLRDGQNRSGMAECGLFLSSPASDWNDRMDALSQVFCHEILMGFAIADKLETIQNNVIFRRFCSMTGQPT